MAFSFLRAEKGASTASPTRAAVDKVNAPPTADSRTGSVVDDYASALRDTQVFLAAQTTADFYTHTAARAVKHAAVCEILLGRPESALRTIEWLDQFDFIGSTVERRAG